MNQPFCWWGVGWFNPVVMLLIMLAVMLLACYLFMGRGRLRPPWAPPAERGPAEALEILKQRYARGEISREEFQQMKRDVRD